MKKLYSLRCVLKYADGKTWRGMWDKSGTALSDMAAGQPKEDLFSVCIEAKNLETRAVSEVVSCEADKFEKFQWLAIARTPSLIRGNLTIQGTIAGLTIQTKKERVTAFVDGTTHIENIEV